MSKIGPAGPEISLSTFMVSGRIFDDILSIFVKSRLFDTQDKEWFVRSIVRSGVTIVNSHQANWSVIFADFASTC